MDRDPIPRPVGLSRRHILQGLAALPAVGLLAPAQASASGGAALIKESQRVLGALLQASRRAEEYCDLAHAFLIFPHIAAVGPEIDMGTGVLLVGTSCGGYFQMTAPREAIAAPESAKSVLICFYDDNELARLVRASQWKIGLDASYGASMLWRADRARGLKGAPFLVFAIDEGGVPLDRTTFAAAVSRTSLATS
ncbi:hypothetical protein ACFB49_36660 [Sphingomonas sp. DBB INV C78]|uniref:hypothetical protein n=1 Tax=Sphingomonas sp. DBB INV C78 TaxID=3349434 RepID=UPI0036D33601